MILVVHKLADQTEGARVPRWRVDTGERYLVNPETGAEEAWPLLGVKLAGSLGGERTEGAPDLTGASMTAVEQWEREGWVRLEGLEVTHAPGGPPEQPWRVTHTFRTAKRIIFSTLDEGNVVYQVIGNPGKYDDPESHDGKRVDWFYALKRVG
jgi:hypothetical protein